MIVTPTFEGIVNSFIDNLRATIPEASTTPVSVIREALINPTAAQLSALYNVAQRISVLQNIFEATSTDLDNLAATYNITRRGGTVSYGSVIVDLSGLLTTSSVVIPAGTILKTTGSDSTTFSTTSESVFYATDRASYEAAASAIRSTLDSIGYNSVALVGTITVQSNSQGFNANVGAFTINNIVSANIARVTNLSPTAGGSDSETDDSLRARIAAIFTGNSVGTQASLLSAALSTVGVTSGFLVKSGDPLMTRDGSTYDTNGNLITPGSGRSVDIYIQGISLATFAQTPQFIVNDLDYFLSDSNSVLIGQPPTGTSLGFLPVYSVTSLTGTESGATFVVAAATQDSEGNILFEGNYALISDVEADQYNIVQNLITGERKLALYLSPTNTVYTIVESLKTSNYANSSLSRDRILFLQNTVTVSDENVTKGIFGGADQLKFKNVTDIGQITTKQTLTEVIRVDDLIQVPGGIGIQVRNKPIVSVISATNTRLGTTYTTEVTSASEGIIRLVGRFPPRAGDYIEVAYVWQNEFVKDLHYSLSGDLIDWSVPNRSIVDATLLPSTTLDTSMTLAIQPPVPSRIRLSIEGSSDREIISSIITGTKVDFVANQLALASSVPTTANPDSYRFALTGLTNIGKLLRVTNLTQGFDYNLTGYKLKTNKFDPTISIDAELLPQEFILNKKTNAEILAPGDKLLLARPSQTISLSSKADFENNVFDNIAPIFDPTQLDFTAGGVILKSPLLDTTSTVTTVSGLITQDLELSGLVNVTGDLVVAENVILTIAPSTVIQVTPSSQLSNLVPSIQNVFFDPALRQEATIDIPVLESYQEFLYIFIKPDNFISNFFTIINDYGQVLSIRFDQDILTKEVVTISTNKILKYRLNGTEIPAPFYPQLEASINLADVTTSLKATLIGAKKGDTSGATVFASARVNNSNKFYILLESIPNTSNSLLSDFNLVVASDPGSSFQLFSYDSKLNSIIVDGSIVSLDGYGYGTSITPAPTATLTTVDVYDETNTFDPNLFSKVYVQDYSGIEVGQLLYQASEGVTSIDPTTLVTAVIVEIDTVYDVINDGYGLTLTPPQIVILDATPTISSEPFKHYLADGDVQWSIWKTDQLVYIITDTVDPINYLLAYTTSKSQRLSIIVDGTLDIRGTTPETSVLFTSAAGSTSAPGDWEGIIFTAKSSSESTLLKQSNLNYARIRFANTGINIQSSDVNVQNCVIRDCLSSGVTITSSLAERNQYKEDVWQPLKLSLLSPVDRIGFISSDSLRLARFPIQGRLVTSLGTIPSFKQKLTDTSYVVDFQEGIDVKVYIGLQPVDIGRDGYASTALTLGTDYMFEFDLYSGYSLVFLYTENSQKLRNTRNLISDLQSKQLSSTITMRGYFARQNGAIYNNLIFNTDVGVALNSLATSAVNKNTIDNTRLGISSQSSMSIVRNNLITNFSSTGLATDSNSLLLAQRNDIFSAKVVDDVRANIVETDLLLKSIGALQTNLLVRTPFKYQVGTVIKINNEQMMVQGYNDSGDEITVIRGQNNTAFGSHTAGSLVTIYQLNAIFTVTGVEGDSCTLIPTDQLGNALSTSSPIQMRAIAANTFRAAFPINRRVDFYYRYKYSTTGSSFSKQTETKVFQKTQPGIGINDIITIYHELPLTQGRTFTPNMENLSIDPLYTAAEVADYSFSPITSLASKQNPAYGSLIEENKITHRYVGFLDIEYSVDLSPGDIAVPAYGIPLVIDTLTQEISISRLDSANNNIPLAVSSFSFETTTAEAEQGIVGKFKLTQPLTTITAGTFIVKYKSATDLGTSLPPYYIRSIISYVLDAKSHVAFDSLNFTKDKIGGNVNFTLRIADSLADLTNAESSSVANANPINIVDIQNNNAGQFIQIDIELAGNDSSYTPELLYQFPILQDFNLSFTPAKDGKLYTILALTYSQVENTTSVLLDAPISTDTYNNVGSDATLEVFALQRSNNFDTAQQFIAANAAGVSVGDTAIQVYGNLTTAKPNASSIDTVRVDYMSYTFGEETLYFTADSAQVTGNYYGSVDSISTTFMRDGSSILPTTEAITIESVSQPSSGDTYQVSYKFEAPLDGETLDITYTYNQAVRAASQNVINQSSLFTDAQVRQATTVAVTIGVTLTVDPGTAPIPVQTSVANAIVQLFNNFVDITSARTLNDSEIIRATGTIVGIQDISITTLSRNGLLGEVADLVFVQRESPILADGSPRINTIQNGQTVTLGSA